MTDRVDAPHGPDALRALVGGALARDAFHSLFARELRDVQCGWPRKVGALEQPAWLRAGDVLIEFAAQEADEPFALGCTLAADGAVQLVDALLGGRVESSLASRAGTPSDAECGVLAYAAARLLATTRAPYRLRDVRPANMAIAAQDLVVWPVSLHTSSGSIALSIWLSQQRASATGLHRLEVLLPESVPRDEVLATGDVFICEDAVLTQTSEGLVGPVCLRVDGCQSALRAQLQRGCVQALGGTAQDVGDTALCIGSCALSLWELAELTSGARWRVDTSEPARLLRGGHELARGELITWRGRIGLRVG